VLTENKPVPHTWFPPLAGLDILCLACGGGQQGPVFAAAGGHVTVLDNSPRQLDRDREVAEREGLAITTVEGDMRDLSRFAAESFDLIFHPVSNNFVPDVLPVWRGAYRVLRRSGVLMAGFMNPDVYVFDAADAEMGIMELRYTLPFDPMKFSEQERLRMFGADSPLEFSHTIDDLIGGQLDAGFLLAALYSDMQNGPLGKFMPAYIATRAIKP
jgi:SAM-dependent methyltransferase